MSTPGKNHHTIQVWFEGPHGQRSAPIQKLIHVSRRCENCTHDGLQDAEWQADDGIAKFGRCMNLCPIADLEDASQHFCDSHQVLREFDAFIHQPHVPVFAVVKGGAA